MHKNSVFPRNLLNRTRGCTILNPSRKGALFFPSARIWVWSTDHMGHSKAHRRLLFCAALFSFGSLSGAMTLMRLSDASAFRIVVRCCEFMSVRPFLRIPTMIMLPAVLTCASAWATSFSTVLLCFSGFISGAAMDASLRFSCSPLLMCGFLILYALCMVRLSASVLHLASCTRLQLRSSGRFRPDRSYDWKLAACASSVLLMASFALAYYLLRT